MPDNSDLYRACKLTNVFEYVVRIFELTILIYFVFNKFTLLQTFFSLF